MSCLFFFFSKTTLSQQLYLRIKIIYINNTQNALNSIQDSGSEDKKDESLVVCQLGASIIYKKYDSFPSCCLLLFDAFEQVLMPLENWNTGRKRPADLTLWEHAELQLQTKTWTESYIWCTVWRYSTLNVLKTLDNGHVGVLHRGGTSLLASGCAVCKNCGNAQLIWEKTSLVRYDRQGFVYTTVYRVYMQYIICEDCSQWCAYI